MKTYNEVAKTVGLDERTRKRYVNYMTIRWKDTEDQKCKDGYAIEWAERFKNKYEFEASDVFGQAILLTLPEEI